MSEHRMAEELEEAMDRTEGVAERITQRGIRMWRQDQYVVVFVLILGTLLSTAFLGEGLVGMVVTLLLMIATLVVALRTSGAGARIQMVATVVSIVALLLVSGAIVSHQVSLARLAYGVTMVVLVVATPYVIGRRIASHLTVNVATITGAADIYLLFGLFFATLFSLIGTLISHHGQTAAQAFLVASRPVTPGDLVYFSFTTLTTVGYGDLTASTGIGRMLAVSEALIGQLYLVTIVALLVANVGRTRQREADGSVKPVIDRKR